VAASAPGERRSRLDAVALLALVGCCFLWGLNQVVMKLTLAEVPPLTQAALRSLGAAVLVMAWAAWRGLDLWQRDGTARGGGWAALLFAAEFACIFVGLQFTSASRMAVFIYLAPFIVALGMPWIARGERLGAWAWAGLVLAFAGVAAAFAEGFTRPAVGPLQWLGDALGIAAAVLWAGTTLVIRATALSQAQPEKTLLYQLGGSGVLLAFAAVVAGEQPGWPWSAATWGLLGFQTVIVTFASYLVWFWLIRHYVATRLSAFVLLTPVFGLLCGVGLLGEPLTLPLVLGLVAVAVGIAAVSLTKPRPG
jgi:drug/metabolite transporter (DMT)-like permease